MSAAESIARSLPAPKFEFGTKAETLERLVGVVGNASLLEQYYFSVEDYQRSPQAVLSTIAARFGTGVAVRSSAQCEDGARHSMAGAFDSRLGVDSSNPDELRGAIEEVIATYAGDPRDQVLVQPMLEDIAVSGVIMTHEIEHGSPYHVIDYDDMSGRTDTITGGTGANKTVMVYRRAGQHDIQSARIARFVGLARELEQICGGVPVDIEFALGKNDVLYLLQARRISLRRNWHPGTELRVTRQLEFVESYIDQRSTPQDGVVGRRTVLASMPDWNPAEIIGSTPRPLAASLYRELVTRRVWRTSRAAMGYREAPPVELMVMVGGHPLIDVRHSFNSFLPAGLDDSICSVLVDAWIDRLAAHPELHDKVEFEIVPTCKDFCFERTAWRRYPGLLDASAHEQFSDRLTALTRGAIARSGPGSIETAMASIARLEDRQAARAAEPSADTRPMATLSRARALLEECERLGTFAFSIAARHGFIAEALLRSAVERGAITDERVRSLKRSIPTITSWLMADFGKVLRGEAAPETFMARYGHLRPGTYDITSLRYDERDDLFSAGAEPGSSGGEHVFQPSTTEQAALGALIDESGLDCEVHDLFAYAARAIAGREYAKFVFTRNLSDALALLVTWGEQVGLDRDDLSYLSWRSIEDTLTHPPLEHTDRQLLSIADEGRRAVEAARVLRLSHIIRDRDDIYVVPVHRSRPNFIGGGRVEADVVHLGPHTPTQTDLGGKIVAVENADPGFDWIFTKGIAGLITKYGGPNSHMAIRCAEFGLAAAIGCGEQTFERMVGAGHIELDCAAKALRALIGG